MSVEVWNKVRFSGIHIWYRDSVRFGLQADWPVQNHVGFPEKLLACGSNVVMQPTVGTTETNRLSGSEVGGERRLIVMKGRRRLGKKRIETSGE